MEGPGHRSLQTQENHAMTVTETPSLRAIVGLDAATCAVMSTLLLGGGGILSSFLGIPHVVLTGAGILLFPVAVFMAFVAARASAPGWAAWIVIAGNAAWVIASLALVLGPFITPTKLGIAFILAQAAVVAILAVAEYRAYMKNAGSLENLA